MTYDPGSELPRLAAALTDIPRLAAEGTLGVVAFALVPDPALYRLTPDGARELRQEITHRLATLLRPRDQLYTIGEWEWLAALPGMVSPAALPLAMLKLRRGFAGDPLSIPLPAVSCGAARWPDDGRDAFHLVQSARIARLEAEKSGSGNELYRPALEHCDARQQEMDREFRDALVANRGLRLHLQPQMDLEHGRCVGAEALLRWQRANGEWAPPSAALAGVERLGLRQSFNRWLFQQAVQIQSQLAAAGIDLVLSLNLSAADLLDVELPDIIAQALALWEIPSGRLLLEITETVMVEETREVMEVLHRLRGMGLALSIDDFGTGYAGMSYLQQLPVQEVKIDQRFIRRAAESTRDREIIASIAQLADRLGLAVVAEGVESAAVRDAILAQGCRRAQGNYFAPPMAVEDFIAWWQAGCPVSG